MKIAPFEMERWQSLHENEVEYNLSESGVQPFRVSELCDLCGVDPSPVSLGYGHTDGTPLLRERIAGLYPGASAAHVLCTTGSAEANFVAMWRLVEPGDRIVIVQPAYAQSAGLAIAMGADVREVWLEEERGWQPAPGAAAETISAGTRLVVVTNPNNPTGSRLSPAAIDEIAGAADRVGAWVLADEVYAGAELDGTPTRSFWGCGERVLVSSSLSKAYGLPGLRLGWLVGPREWREELWSRKDYTTVAPSALSDHLAAAALEPEVRRKILARTRRILRENLDVVLEWTHRQGEVLRFVPPAAGAIAFFGYEAEVSSRELAERLRVEEDVLLVPGAHFGLEGYFRIGYGYHGARLPEALARVSGMLDRIRAAARAS